MKDSGGAVIRESNYTYDAFDKRIGGIGGPGRGGAGGCQRALDGV